MKIGIEWVQSGMQTEDAHTMTLGKRPEGHKVSGHLEKYVPGRGKSTGKGPMLGVSLECVSNSSWPPWLQPSERKVSEIRRNKSGWLIVEALE